MTMTTPGILTATCCSPPPLPPPRWCMTRPLISGPRCLSQAPPQVRVLTGHPAGPPCTSLQFTFWETGPSQKWIFSPNIFCNYLETVKSATIFTNLTSIKDVSWWKRNPSRMIGLIQVSPRVTAISTSSVAVRWAECRTYDSCDLSLCQDASVERFSVMIGVWGGADSLR